MKSTYQQALDEGVFPHEGGYTNHPADPGGPTNWGITIYDARKYWKPDATAADVKAMPKAIARAIYAAHYAAPLRYDDLPAGVDYAVLDYGINSGVSRAAKVLQRLCDVPADGVIGAASLEAVSRRAPKALIEAICDERLRFLKSLKTWPTFGKGWGRRVAEVRALALHFAAVAAAAPQAAPKPTPTQASECMAKGVVPPGVVETAAEHKGKIAAGATGGAALGWHEWIAAHPFATAAIVVAIVALAAAAIALARRMRAAKQDAPTPGIMPVPAK
jgi:lysozyme family protein